MLYAQSVGFGRNPLDRKELAYVYEQGTPLRTVPTLASAIVPDMFPPDLGWDYGQVLHVEQSLISQLAGRQLENRGVGQGTASTAATVGGHVLVEVNDPVR